MSDLYRITVTAAELDVVRLALGRMVEPERTRAKAKPVEVFSPDTGDDRLDAFMRAHHDPKWKPPAAPKRYVPKPPRLSDKRFGIIEHQWAEAVENPQRWRNQLIIDVSKRTGRHGDYNDVPKAWGLDAKTGL